MCNAEKHLLEHLTASEGERPTLWQQRKKNIYPSKIRKDLRISSSLVHNVVRFRESGETLKADMILWECRDTPTVSEHSLSLFPQMQIKTMQKHNRVKIWIWIVQPGEETSGLLSAQQPAWGGGHSVGELHICGGSILLCTGSAARRHTTLCRCYSDVAQ